MTRRSEREAQRASGARWSRRRGVLGAFGGLAVLGFVAAYAVPTGAAIAEGLDDSSTNGTNAEAAISSDYATAADEAQKYAVSASIGPAGSLKYGDYEVFVPEPEPTPEPQPLAEDDGSTDEGGSGDDGGSGDEGGSDDGGGGETWQPPFVAPDPGTAQSIAYDMVMARGWGEAEFGCLLALWDRESGWNVSAYNSSSGAYGIPQALPGSKMASHGADWQTNPATQIAWGLDYIGGRYGAPCGAWGHSESYGWY